MKPAVVLIVDDEEDILEFLKYNLEKHHFEVHTCTRGTKAIELTKKIQPDLIILDVMMPEMDGIETCSEIRNLSCGKKALITFLSARSEDYSQIAGLDAGADDYIKKPVRPKVLISRLNALLRRAPENQEKEAITAINDLTIDREKYEVRNGGEIIPLPKKEFELLSLLSSKPNKVFSREEIFNSIWGGEVIIGDRTIDVHIRKLREKIGLESIKTYKGIGYSFSTKAYTNN